MKLVVIESAYAGAIEANVKFCEAVCRYASLNGYAPLASHLFYTRFLNDLNPHERMLGIQAGLAWAKHAEEAWFCFRIGEGLSTGMTLALNRHLSEGRPVIFKNFSQDGEFLGYREVEVPNAR